MLARARFTATALRLAAVLALAAGILTATSSTPPASAATCGVLSSGAASQAQAAVTKACGLIGTPYSWGGGHGSSPGPSYGICDASNGAPNDCNVRGLDCSGMVRYAYYLAVGADVIPGTSREQYQTSRAVARFTAGQGTGPLLPGDLVFFGGTASTIHHVAIYLGQGQIVEAPYSGGYVRVTALYNHGDYYGAVRLYGGGGGTTPPPSKVWVDTFADAGVYASPTSTARTGTLWAATNYVYCRVWGREVRSGSSYNHWWLLTDPDVGPARQYVSAYYLTRWGDDVAKDNSGNDIRDC